MSNSNSKSYAELQSEIAELETQRESLNSTLRKLRKAAEAAERAELEARAQSLGLRLLEQFGDGDSVLAALENGRSESPNSNREDEPQQADSGSDFDHDSAPQESDSGHDSNHEDVGQAAPWRSDFDRGDAPAPHGFANGEAVGGHVG